MSTVLVVEDEGTVREVVCAYLHRAGLPTHEAADGLVTVRAFPDVRPAVVVLDVMVPGIDGFEVLRRIRAIDPDVPVLMLTARSAEQDRIAGLELGADDYVTKPFSARELVLRVQGLLRRSAGTSPGGAPGGTIEEGDLVVDRGARRATRAGAELALTSREFDLLVHLMTHPGVVLDRDDLLREVWGWEVGDRSTVTVHVRRLREKVEVDPSRPERISTVWGRGYRWDREQGCADEA
ncbi:two-component system response regulator [Serinicoccus chungangensis]|uniref:Two-component system response regulator n=1 Tax=Serinicoccus chungangensis TaxID=767452 RepID=A0A0W8I2C2_9MICO|nr:response regulator transcription factor [Serinicoccus chungangensis]KUG51905.1 two-component system response regulator [Serinicoccus chungangensis]